MLVNQNHYLLQEETEEVIVSLRKDGIVHVFIKPNTHITQGVKHRMVETYKKITRIPRPFIFEAGEFTSISKEARQTSGQLHENSPVKATAIVVKNLGQRILADYYYKFNKPQSPTQIFKSKDEAIHWLMENFLD